MAMQRGDEAREEAREEARPEARGEARPEVREEAREEARPKVRGEAQGTPRDKGQTILGWRGLLGELDAKARTIVWAGLFVLAASMTFVQFGFVGVGLSGDYVGYVLALLGPVAVAALLLGKGWGALEGAAAGAVLLLHSNMQPLDIFEKYFVTPLSSIVLYAVAGLLLGLLFAVGLRKDPKGPVRVLAILVPAAVVAVLAAFAQYLVTLLETMSSPSTDSLLAAVGMGSFEVQAGLNFLLMAILSLLADRAARWYVETRTYASVRNIIRTRLILSLFLSFMVISAVGFVGITQLEIKDGEDGIVHEMEYIADEFSKRWTATDNVLSREEVQELPSELWDTIYDGIGVDGVLEGYDLTDGTVAIYFGNWVVLTDNERYKDTTPLEDYDDKNENLVSEAAETGQMYQIVYSDGSENVELGYMRACKVDAASNESGNVYVMFARPFSMVFASRSMTMLWTSLSVFVLLAVVYLLVSQLIRRTVIVPVDNTNASLGKITEGDLDEMVSEVGSVEFASLSAGINVTVDSLKQYAAESKRRIERDLATARAIQIGALPKVFPAFPGVQEVDLYAAMDAAKEVGGDFYDFFQIDDHTVGFLIADVSGKGIPGALFMMAAKAEIQHHLSSGMEPASAMAAANAYLCAHNEAGMFVTVWAAALDWQTGLLTYVNAGHNFPLLRHGRGGQWEWVKKKCGLFLGTFEVAKYRQETLVLEPGDELLLYTDGVNEAFSITEEEYGNDRLEAFLAAHSDLRPEQMVQALRADVAAWAEGAEQSDDVTILAVEYRA